MLVTQKYTCTKHCKTAASLLLIYWSCMLLALAFTPTKHHIFSPSTNPFCFVQEMSRPLKNSVPRYVHHSLQWRHMLITWYSNVNTERKHIYMTCINNLQFWHPNTGSWMRRTWQNKFGKLCILQSTQCMCTRERGPVTKMYLQPKVPQFTTLCNAMSHWPRPTPLSSSNLICPTMIHLCDQTNQRGYTKHCNNICVCIAMRT